MSPPGDEGLDKLVQAVRRSARYRHVTEDLVRHVGQRELSIRRNLKEAIKATKNKLHQVTGAYLETSPDYRAMLAELAAVPPGNDDEWRRVGRRLLAAHASTRERLPILEDFYRRTLASRPPVRSVLDVACGLNPLAIPWMPLAPGANYYAYDAYDDLAAFLQAYFGLLGGRVQGYAKAQDVVFTPPVERVELALVLKTLPVLDQLRRSASSHLLAALHAATVLVSFPAASLGGREKGMVENYSARFLQQLDNDRWSVEKFTFDTEVVFRLDRRPG